MVSLFYGMSIFMDYIMSKPSLWKNSSDTLVYRKEQQ